MNGEILQVRDVPSDEMRRLRARAAARGVSLSAYLRELIHDDVSRPAMTEVLERIASRSSVEATDEDIRASIEDDQR
ncbi:MAG: hypothetical protein DCC50_11420 [Acidobacteria bacterium]|nr:MAG: hypothetical protein DCC50_11420 [Acidobacteriota bacterium]